MNLFGRNFRRNERGQIVVIVGISMFALIAAVGLATDATILYMAKQNLQRAVDAAALAASRKLPNQAVASQTAYEFMRLHGYNFDPASNPLSIAFPTYSPPRKAIMISATTDAEFIFLRLVGWENSSVSADGEGESAPLDVYVILDLSQSMVYDTPQPGDWPASAVGGCTDWNNSQCVALYCNQNRNCDPLDTNIKPAARFFVDELSPQFDRVGIVSYDRQGTHVLALEDDFNAVKTAIDNLDAYEPTGKSTNIGDGILFAHTQIALEGRLDAIWSMVLLTDGRANVYRNCPGCPPNCSGGVCATLYECNECSQAEDWAVNNAIDTWNRHETVIYTIAYGDIFVTNPQYRDLMTEIADRTDNGVLDGATENFWAAPDETALRVALSEIADRIFTRLLR